MSITLLSEIIFCDWLSLNGGMPQGLWLGPLTFIVIIYDLFTGCLMHKFVDGSTLSELISKDGVSQMETFLGDVLNWSALNLMYINITKTKEMIDGTNVNPPPQLIFLVNRFVN